MRKSKNRYFYDILLFPGDAPGAITLDVVWMEREVDAYKSSRCMCPSNYYRFWDTARYLWKKIVILSYALAFDAPVRGFPSEYRHPLWDGKLEWCRYPRVYVYAIAWFEALNFAERSRLKSNSVLMYPAIEQSIYVTTTTNWRCYWPWTYAHAVPLIIQPQYCRPVTTIKQYLDDECMSSDGDNVFYFNAASL